MARSGIRTERRSIGGKLVNEAGTSTQFAGWSPDGKTAVVLRGWESVENARWEEEHKTIRFTPEGWRISYHENYQVYWPTPMA
jgi:TolB protein